MIAVILINAVLGIAVVYGLLLLLVHGIRTDRAPVQPVRSLPVARSKQTRVAA